MSVEYEYPGGVRVTHLGRQMDQCTNRSSITLQGSRGRATLDFGHAKIEGDQPFQYDSRRVQPAIQQYADMIATIRSNEPINEGRQVAESTMTAILGRMSGYTGRALKWDWAMNSAKLDLSPPTLAFGDLPERPVAIPGVRKLI